MGLFIAIEGGDGAGKKTQSKLLQDQLTKEGYIVVSESFPRYDKPINIIIENFLNGKYGDLHPEVAGYPYAIDRMLASDTIRKALVPKNGIYLADRFTGSNLGHNGSKFKTRKERLEYFEFQRNYEHVILGTPKPDHNFIFQVPPDTAQSNIDKKSKRNYTDKKRDIHEADASHLQRTYDTYTLLATTYPEEYTIINPMKTATSMRSIAEIHEELYANVKHLMTFSSPAL